MEQSILISCAVFAIMIVVLRRRYMNTGQAGQAAKELRRLTARQSEGTSEPQDLPDWEAALNKLEAFPSNYNKLNMEIHFDEAFLFYLEQHYPSDERITPLMAAAGFRRDSIWGLKINKH